MKHSNCFQSVFLAALLLGCISCLQSSRIHQTTQGFADLNVVLAGSEAPAFRALLPEILWINGERHFCHATPGRWHQMGNQLWGGWYRVAEVEISVQVTAGYNEIKVILEFKNRNKKDLQNVWMESCAALNNLRGPYGWCNRQFIPSNIPLIRSVQGDYWYEQLAPKRLFALTTEGWVPMHPHPDNPDHRQVPKYSFEPGPKPNARACAVQSPDGKAWFYQAWKSNGYYCTPCPGNACMHLRPFLVKTFKPGDSVSIEGIFGIYNGSRKDLTNKINIFCDER